MMHPGITHRPPRICDIFRGVFSGTAALHFPVFYILRFFRFPNVFIGMFSLFSGLHMQISGRIFLHFCHYSVA